MDSEETPAAAAPPQEGEGEGKPGESPTPATPEKKKKQGLVWAGLIIGVLGILVTIWLYRKQQQQKAMQQAAVDGMQAGQPVGAAMPGGGGGGGGMAMPPAYQLPSVGSNSSATNPSPVGQSSHAPDTTITGARTEGNVTTYYNAEGQALAPGTGTGAITDPTQIASIISGQRDKPAFTPPILPEGFQANNPYSTTNTFQMYAPPTFESLVNPTVQTGATWGVPTAAQAAAAAANAAAHPAPPPEPEEYNRKSGQVEQAWLDWQKLYGGG